MHSDRAFLLDIRDNIHFARQFTAGLTIDQFDASVEKLYAVVRCLEIVSEASRRLSPEVKDRHPEILWRLIAGAGNVYRHNYERVGAEIIWGTVQNALGPLLEVVEAELFREAPSCG